MIQATTTLTFTADERADFIQLLSILCQKQHNIPNILLKLDLTPESERTHIRLLGNRSSGCTTTHLLLSRHDAKLHAKQKCKDLNSLLCVKFRDLLYL
jgi:hypothetical protein